MSIWGKIVGSAAGLALGGPLGALLGGLAGHAVDRMREDSEDDPTRHIAFTIGVIALGAKMAKADGRVTADEVRAFRQVFRIPPDEEKNVGRLFDQAKRDARGFEPYARQIAGLFRDNPAVLEELLGALFHIARADGVIHADELTYLREVARIFGFDDDAFERIRIEHLGPAAVADTDPYRLLGVAADADDATIKAAHRRLVRENHPDVLTAQGLPPEFVDLANEKLATINAAYDRIKAERQMR